MRNAIIGRFLEEARSISLPTCEDAIAFSDNTSTKALAPLIARAIASAYSAPCIPPRARTPRRVWRDTVDADGHDRDRSGHSVAQHQSERRTDFLEAIGPVGLDVRYSIRLTLATISANHFRSIVVVMTSTELLPRSLGHRLDRSFAIENASAAWDSGLIASGHASETLRGLYEEWIAWHLVYLNLLILLALPTGFEPVLQP